MKDLTKRSDAVEPAAVFNSVKALNDGSEPMLRYAIGLAVAFLLIVAGVLYVRQVERSVEQQARQSLRDAYAAANLPPRIAPEAPGLPDVGVSLPASEMRRLAFAHFLIIWRYVLIPLVLLGSLGIARALRRNGP